MKCLVQWDDDEQRDLLALYLTVDPEDEVFRGDSTEELLAIARSSQPLDCIVVAVDDDRAAFDLFHTLHTMRPHVPIVGCCRPESVFRIAKFITAGMQTYVVRDPRGDFLFLLRQMIDGVVQSSQALRERLAADRLLREAESVRRLQQALLDGPIAAPEGYTVAGRYRPGVRLDGDGQPRSASGDVAAVLPLPDGRLGMIIGGTGSHGLRASLTILTLHTLLRSFGVDERQARGGRRPQPCQMIERVGAALRDQVDEAGGTPAFVTLLVLLLDPKRHAVEWASAGHPLPLRQPAGGEAAAVGEDAAVGLPLGSCERAKYRTHRLTLEPGDRLLVHGEQLAVPDDASGESDNDRLLDHLFAAADGPHDRSALVLSRDGD